MKILNLFALAIVFYSAIIVSTAQAPRAIESRGLIILNERPNKSEIFKWNEANYPIKLESISQSRPYFTAIYTDQDFDQIESKIEQLGIIEFAKKAMPITYRETIPDDNLYSEQWSLEQIGLPEVWDQTTGGTTENGEDIVVAVVDDGFYADHEELLPNLFINIEEIPGNGIDDDQNGYIDDYRGYNSLTNNDQHTLKNHGTQVAGIIGAKGNNDTGISGINWDVKILLVSGASFESEVVEGYEYIKAMKELYISSNGEKGANILVTNFSGGVSGLTEDDNPTWCQLYEDLGNLGILSIGAVENTNVDYAINDDLPTKCSSDFLIMTTNTNQIDSKVFSAGYGQRDVDLGAPGEDIPSIINTSNYNNISGTSASAPHIAGAIALLYSMNCDLLSNGTTSDRDIALKMKQAILESTVRLPDLIAKTVSGGRLNVNAASLKWRELCGLSSKPLDLAFTNVLTSPNLNISFTTTSNNPVEISVYSANGQMITKETIESPTVFTANELVIPLAEHAGVYFITLDNETDHITKQVVLVR